MITEPPTAGCRPAAGVYWRRPKVTVIAPGIQGYYLRACSQDSDCMRPNDLNKSLYSCDPGLGACTPTDLYTVSIGSPVTAEPFCAGGRFIPKQ